MHVVSQRFTKAYNEVGKLLVAHETGSIMPYSVSAVQEVWWFYWFGNKSNHRVCEPYMCTTISQIGMLPSKRG